MRGVGTSRAAISVVNALPLGIGSAIGVEWPARATVHTREGPPRTTILPRAARTPLVRATIRRAMEKFGGRSPCAIRLLVSSTIPSARGLKSSSAVSSSVALAAARAFGQDPSPEEVAGLAAEVGRATGVSATGAFDDALAGLLPGGVVTDNRSDRLLSKFCLEPGLGVAVWFPERRHPPSPDLLARFRRERGLARTAADAVLDGDWTRAMEVNSSLVERVMGYRYGPLHAAVERAGAVASGVSGLGPAFAAVAPTERLPAILRRLPSTGRRRSLRVFTASSRGGNAR